MQKIEDMATVSYSVDFLVFSAWILRPNSAVTASVPSARCSWTMSGDGLGYEILGAVKVKDGLFIGDALAAQGRATLAMASWQLMRRGFEQPILEQSAHFCRNLYVAGLPPGFNDAHLFQLFDRYGRIWSSRVCPSRRLGGFGYAFVKYGDPSHAAAAVRNLNGYDVGGACITVKFADNDRPPPEEGKGKGGKLNPLNIPADNREVFVSGLRANTDEESVREIFKDMGLTTVKVCCEGKPDGQGYALARFRFPEEAQHAIRMTDGMVHRGIKIRTLLSSSAAAAKGQMTTSLTERPTMPSESLFETITAFFGQFAGVNFVKVLDTNGKKGDTVALVRMNTLDEAAWCVDRLNGHETAPNLQLVVRFSDPPRAKGGKGFEDMPVPGVRLRGFTDSPYGEAAPPMAQRPVRSFTSDAPEAQVFQALEPQLQPSMAIHSMVGPAGLACHRMRIRRMGMCPTCHPSHLLMLCRMGMVRHNPPVRHSDSHRHKRFHQVMVVDVSCEAVRRQCLTEPEDLEFVVSNKVTRVINCAGRQVPNHWESIGVAYLTYYWVDSETQVVLDQRDVVSSESFRFIEEALNAAESVLIHSARGQSRSCCILGAYMMRKYNWGLRKTMEFISFRRPDMNLKSAFMQQLSALERRLADKSKQTLSNDWDANFGSLEGEDLLLRNTYLNGQMGPLAEFHSGMHERHMPRRLWWLDQDSHDKNRLEKPAGADRHNLVSQASELKGILRRKPRAMPRQTSTGAGPTPVPGAIAPGPGAPAEGSNGGYRGPEVPTAWADEGEAPHFRFQYRAVKLFLGWLAKTRGIALLWSRVPCELLT
eukprot:s2293_g15.t1